MPGRAGSKFSWPVAFRDRQRFTGCDRMRIEHQHLSNFFFMRSTAADLQAAQVGLPRASCEGNPRLLRFLVAAAEAGGATCGALSGSDCSAAMLLPPQRPVQLLAEAPALESEGCLSCAPSRPQRVELRSRFPVAEPGSHGGLPRFPAAQRPQVVAGGKSSGRSLLWTKGCAGGATCGAFTGRTGSGWFIAMGAPGSRGGRNQVGQRNILLEK